MQFFFHYNIKLVRYLTKALISITHEAKVVQIKFVELIIYFTEYNIHKS